MAYFFGFEETVVRRLKIAVSGHWQILINIKFPKLSEDKLLVFSQLDTMEPREGIPPWSKITS